MKSGRQKPAKSNAAKGYVMENRRWGMIVRHMNPAPSRRFFGSFITLIPWCRNCWNQIFSKFIQQYLLECLFVLWKYFSIFVLSSDWQTYRKCFRTVLNWKCGNFPWREDNERHSFLVWIMDRAHSACPILHIYSSVGYCIVYSLRVRHNLQLDRRNRLHTFLFATNPAIQEPDGNNLCCYD